MLVQYAQNNPDRVFFTSDTHFGHKRIIELCNRPFSSVEEMDETLIKNWNEKVKEGDVVFHLGDFCFKGASHWERISSRLNGQICLVRGNHDRKDWRDKMNNCFDLVVDQIQLELDSHSIYLNHYPFLCYGGSYKEESPVIQLFGHVHSGPSCSGIDCNRMKYLFPTQYDVGVDNNDFKPVSWKEICGYLFGK